MERKVGDFATVAAARAAHDGRTARSAGAGIALTAVGSKNIQATDAGGVAGRRRADRDGVRRGGPAGRRGRRARRRTCAAPPSTSGTSSRCTCDAASPRALEMAARGLRRREGRTMEVTVTVNGAERTADVEPRMLLVAPDPGGVRAHRHAHRVRHHELRRVHGAAGRHAGEVVHDVRRAGRRPRGHDGRGTAGGRRAARRSRRRSRRSTACSAASARRG